MTCPACHGESVNRPEADSATGVTHIVCTVCKNTGKAKGMKRKRIGKQIIDDLSGLGKRGEAEMPKREVIEKCRCGLDPYIKNAKIYCPCINCECELLLPTRVMAIAAWNAAMKSARTKAVKRGK